MNEFSENTSPSLPSNDEAGAVERRRAAAGKGFFGKGGGSRVSQHEPRAEGWSTREKGEGSKP